MTEKPNFILNFNKPVNTEIKRIGNNWYLYERFNKYDPVIKRSRKVSGRCLGKITEAGLVPSVKRKVNVSELLVNDVVSIGSTLFYWQRTATLRERLQKHFPTLWQRLFVTAILRLNDPRFKRLQLHFENSLLAHKFPTLQFSKAENADFLTMLGKRRQAISDFMREDIEQQGAFVLFDGHRLISSSKTMEFAELGYDSKRRYMPQLNLLYVYSVSEHVGAPIYYKQYIGSTPDVSAFADILLETKLAGKNYTIIADKGFASETDFDLMNNRNLNYIVPLHRDNRFTKDRIPDSPSGYEQVFSFKGRAIHSIKVSDDTSATEQVFLYFDAQLYADEMSDATQRAEKLNATNAKKLEHEQARRLKGSGRLTDQEFDELQPINLIDIHEQKPGMGTVTIRTNRTDLNAQQVYCIYKQQQAIEQFFRTYGATLEFDASYMRSREKEEGWLFLNHLSAMIGIEVLHEIAEIDESKNISLDDLTQTLEKITASQVLNQWQVAPIKRSVQKLMMKFEFDCTSKAVEALLVAGDSKSESPT